MKKNLAESKQFIEKIQNKKDLHTYKLTFILRLFSNPEKLHYNAFMN